MHENWIKVQFGGRNLYRKTEILEVFQAFLLLESNKWTKKPKILGLIIEISLETHLEFRNF